MLCLVGAIALGSAALAAEGGDWKDEFEEICAVVKAADSLPAEELQGLIARSDDLLPRIEASDDPAKKVYIFRLKKCRAFFEYILALRSEGR